MRVFPADHVTSPLDARLYIDHLPKRPDIALLNSQPEKCVLLDGTLVSNCPE